MGASDSSHYEDDFEDDVEGQSVPLHGKPSRPSLDFEVKRPSVGMGLSAALGLGRRDSARENRGVAQDHKPAARGTTAHGPFQFGRKLEILDNLSALSIAEL